MKICQVIFSTNRLEYLTKTLQGQKNLDFSDHQVDKIFFDDYPKDRNDSLVKQLVNLYGYEEIYLHKENIGLSATWTEFFNLIKSRYYDHIWHQEDDVEILLNTDKVAVYHPTSEAGSKYYGRNTRWCTAGDEINMFEYYNKISYLYTLEGMTKQIIEYNL